MNRRKLTSGAAVEQALKVFVKARNNLLKVRDAVLNAKEEAEEEVDFYQNKANETVAEIKHLNNQLQSIDSKVAKVNDLLGV